MSRAEAQTLVQAEQALAILREATEPMTATDIGALVGFSHIVECRGGDHWSVPILRMATICQGDGTDLRVRQGILGSHMTDGPLALLLRRGLVTREKVGRRVHWSYVARPEDMEAARLVEELFDAATDSA